MIIWFYYIFFLNFESTVPKVSDNDETDKKSDQKNQSDKLDLQEKVRIQLLIQKPLNAIKLGNKSNQQYIHLSGLR
jgi:hypothetical protein